MSDTHTQDSEELVSISKAAELAFVSVDTIRRYSDKGLLETFRTPTNRRRFRVSAVLALNAPQPSPVPSAPEALGPTVRTSTPEGAASGRGQEKSSASHD